MKAWPTPRAAASFPARGAAGLVSHLISEPEDVVMLSLLVDDVAEDQRRERKAGGQRPGLEPRPGAGIKDAVEELEKVGEGVPDEEGLVLGDDIEWIEDRGREVERLQEDLDD